MGVTTEAGVATTEECLAELRDAATMLPGMVPEGEI